MAAGGFGSQGIHPEQTTGFARKMDKPCFTHASHTLLLRSKGGQPKASRGGSDVAGCFMCQHPALYECKGKLRELYGCQLSIVFPKSQTVHIAQNISLMNI